MVEPKKMEIYCRNESRFSFVASTGLGSETFSTFKYKYLSNGDIKHEFCL